MPYFRELPNLKYISVFNERTGIDEYTLAKNIFKRPKLREDFTSILTAFNYYQVSDNERPDQIAKNYYGTEDFDWIILLTNNIINYNDEWPLDNDSLYKHIIEKYGSEEKLQEIHHYEAMEYKDEYGRVLIEEGTLVDAPVRDTISTNTNTNSYILNSFPSSRSNTVISTNLNQYISVYTREGEENKYNITDIRTTTSNLKILSADAGSTYDVTLLNSLTDWPSSWGGLLRVVNRNNAIVEIFIQDIVLDNKVLVSERLYEITGTLINGEIKPTFNFTNEIIQ
jgi:hypothetical protein